MNPRKWVATAYGWALLELQWAPGAAVTGEGFLHWVVVATMRA